MPLICSINLGIRGSIPPADIAVKIADALHVSVEFLVTGKEKKKTHLLHIYPA